MNDIKEFLKKYKFKPNDLLGQNFLINELTLEQIVSAAEVSSADDVLEIGAGIGNLTKLLAETGANVLAVEKDERYFPILKDQLGDHLQTHTRTPKSKSNVKLVFDDIVRFNFQKELKPGFKVVANIPYYITGKIIEMLVGSKNRPSKIVLLIQKEVAERITAKAGDLSILAISVQLFSNPRIAGIVPRSDFFPEPKVDSAILVLDMLDTPRIEVSEPEFFRLVKAAFAGKRKQIHNTLKNNLGLSEKELANVFKGSLIDPKARPQQLSLDQWFSLYVQLKPFLAKAL
ncbi:MAG: 16S rRNA (adenine(1518)-N(6)/adenine(1519)-N(6))-dimethyltransferase RsmA [Candidatus Doudnabacteria bacterium]